MQFLPREHTLRTQHCMGWLLHKTVRMPPRLKAWVLYMGWIVYPAEAMASKDLRQ